MPVFLLIAVFIAFGFDTPSGPGFEVRSTYHERLAAAAGGILLVTALAFALGRAVASRVGRQGRGSPALRRRYLAANRLLEVFTLVVFTWIVHDREWPRVVRQTLGNRGMPVLDDVLILLPYVLMQAALWWGVYPAERALRGAGSRRPQAGLARHLVLRARQTLGLVLPVLLVLIGQELARSRWPRWSASVGVQLAEAAGMGLFILILSPVFVRLAWPTHSLPAGPLRNRLEHLSRRLRFRCSDILVWDTGQVVVNACITGPLPWLRYILLTDAMIEYLDEYEIAAVFGHEIGHIAHRHLLFFGFFFMGSLGVLALFNQSIDANLAAFSSLFAGKDHPTLATAIEAGAALGMIGLYFLIVFGHVSRRFERQADVFGCLSVSCGQADCPPHADLDRRPGPPATRLSLCPVGIRIFANALGNVAALNGMEPRARSWRHGSIARRIAFLESLEGRPEALRRFQAGIVRLRAAVALILIGVIVVALATGTALPPR